MSWQKAKVLTSKQNAPKCVYIYIYICHVFMVSIKGKYVRCCQTSSQVAEKTVVPCLPLSRSPAIRLLDRQRTGPHVSMWHPRLRRRSPCDKCRVRLSHLESQSTIAQGKSHTETNKHRHTVARHSMQTCATNTQHIAQFTQNWPVLPQTTGFLTWCQGLAVETNFAQTLTLCLTLFAKRTTRTLMPRLFRDLECVASGMWSSPTKTPHKKSVSALSKTQRAKLRRNAHAPISSPTRTWLGVPSTGNWSRFSSREVNKRVLTFFCSLL